MCYSAGRLVANGDAVDGLEDTRMRAVKIRT